jgi:hypothetical protein
MHVGEARPPSPQLAHPPLERGPLFERVVHHADLPQRPAPRAGLGGRGRTARASSLRALERIRPAAAVVLRPRGSPVATGS